MTADLIFEPVEAPEHTRKVIPNPFVDAVAKLSVNGTDALQVTLADPTTKDLNRVDRQLTEAGNKNSVTVRRYVTENDDGSYTVKFHAVSKIERKPNASATPEEDNSLRLSPPDDEG